MRMLDWKLVEQTWMPGSTTPQAYTYRAKVPGGWLVTIWASEEADNDGQRYGGGLTFLPDPKHAWNVRELDELQDMLKARRKGWKAGQRKRKV
jgi:hypothetical protein